MAKILMVDDDREFLEASSAVLKAKGHQVDTADTISQAQQLISGSSFDLIFLDIMMESPDDGIVLAHKLKKAGIKTPIVMLSAVSKVTGYEYGKCNEVLPCSEFLEKPIKPNDLLKKVDKILAKTKGDNNG
jgi:DNA-binding NtrC family response regulator